MIIGITGKKKAGKDTAYSIIKEFIPRAERRAFADKLKQSAAALLGVSIDFLNTNKFNQSDEIHYGRLEWDGVSPANPEVWEDGGVTPFTLREFLQRYGTEAHRDIFGRDFWLEQCLPSSHKSYFRANLIVVTDVRFDNEAAWILDLGGVVWEIQRPSVDDGDTHPSEIPVDAALVSDIIDNSGTLDELKTKVKEKLYELGLTG